MVNVNIGIEDLDILLAEGIPEGSLILLVGNVGSGADLFAQQALYRQVENGVRCAYFAVEKPIDDVRLDMDAFQFKVQPYEEKGDWKFIYVDESIPIDVFQKILIENITEKRWTFLDSLSPIILRTNLTETIKMIKTVKLTARKNGGLHFIHLTHGMHDSQTETTLKHFVDGVFEFKFRPSIRGVGRSLTITKMKGVALEVETIPYRITSRGIAIETATRII